MNQTPNREKELEKEIDMEERMHIQDIRREYPETFKDETDNHMLRRCCDHIALEKKAELKGINEEKEFILQKIKEFGGVRPEWLEEFKKFIE